jgi:DNA-binding response OmpR family regulator
LAVLVVEDEPLIAEAVARALTREGLAVDVVGDGDAALSATSRQRYELIVLDLMLPGRDGLEVCREIRRTDVRTPIIMLTARDALEDKVMGLDSGADDYLTKPYELEELLARVRSLLRRARPSVTARLEISGLVLDGNAREVSCSGRPALLTETEYRLLEYLALRAGEVCRRRELLEHVWGYPFDPRTNVVEVFIRRLRQKLAAAGCPPRIETVRGVGYRFEV